MAVAVIHGWHSVFSCIVATGRSVTYHSPAREKALILRTQGCQELCHGQTESLATGIFRATYCIDQHNYYCSTTRSRTPQNASSS